MLLPYLTRHICRLISAEGEDQPSSSTSDASGSAGRVAVVLYAPCGDLSANASCQACMLREYAQRRCIADAERRSRIECLACISVYDHTPLRQATGSVSRRSSHFPSR